MGPWELMTHWAGELDDFQISPAFSSLLCALEDASVASCGFSQWEAPLEVRGWEEGAVRVFLPRLPPFRAVAGRCLHSSPEDRSASQAAPSYGPSSGQILMAAAFPQVQPQGSQSFQQLLTPGASGAPVGSLDPVPCK